MLNNKTVQLIFEAIDEINETLDSPIEKNDIAVLFGKDSQLDSMELVSLIVTIERLIEDKYNRSLTLASEKAFSRSKSPFRTVATLAEFIEELLSEDN